jgi:hypothetical protein
MTQINPAVIEEARWFDGEPTMRDLADLAARRNLPLHVERERSLSFAIPKHDLAVHQTLVLCAELRLRDCERQLADARAELRKRTADLQAAIAREVGG